MFRVCIPSFHEFVDGKSNFLFMKKIKFFIYENFSDQIFYL